MLPSDKNQGYRCDRFILAFLPTPTNGRQQRELQAGFRSLEQNGSVIGQAFLCDQSFE
ncbi:hypothetical protein [Nostoc sp. WHI]|uniref:hypothetical protein n=1 Tax=Nostoc sp. WHI TaxID=2650611 RepID=UPI0018C4C7C7|nr:hypothetical protein [Nostoc sp. WHI]